MTGTVTFPSDDPINTDLVYGGDWIQFNYQGPWCKIQGATGGTLTGGSITIDLDVSQGQQFPWSTSVTESTPTTTQLAHDPAKPSQDFFGLTVGAIGCLPNMTPAAYPPMSLLIVTRMKTMMRLTPSGAWRSIIANDTSAGT